MLNQYPAMPFKFITLLSFLFSLIISRENNVLPEEKLLNEPIVLVNQVAYLPGLPKSALVTSPASGSFEVTDADGSIVLSGQMTPARDWDKAGMPVSVADLTSIDEPGTYQIKVENADPVSFRVGLRPSVDLVRAASKYYYFNRASTELPEQYAGEFHREAGHPDRETYIHATAASPGRPAGSTISTPYGWYDAGDYNKYVVNSGITTYTLMMTWVQNRALMDTLTWNIPESGNEVPDLLDEVRWNLEWMLSMQDPSDGGVYHKNTTAGFEGFVIPSKATSKRYVTAKGTAATLDFAAVMARASRVFKPYDASFSEMMLEGAQQAWVWAVANPDSEFRNPQENVPDGPAISTGQYGDGNFSDEFFWAAVELYLATGDEMYRTRANPDIMDSFGTPAWPNVESLGLVSILADDNASPELQGKAKRALLELADQLMADYQASPAGIPLTRFRWGSNSDILNQSLILINAFHISEQESYLKAAVASLDYVLGANVTGYCFVTGFGKKSPVNLHHRPSAADGIAKPFPGMLAGGPNPYNMAQDCGKDAYPDHHPAAAFIDEECSYSTNEVAINWNAPLVYVSASLRSAAK